jgi:hypothetical protein
MSGCAVRDVRPVSEILSSDSSLIALSLRQSYKSRIGYWHAIVASLDRQGSEGLASINAAPLGDQEIGKEIVRTHSKHFVGNVHPGGTLNVLRAKPGRYVLREWIRPRDVGGTFAAGVPITWGRPELRGPLDLEFVVRANEVVYLGEILLDEGARVVASDCAKRDVPLLVDLVDGLKADKVRFAPIGSNSCVE